MAAQIVQSWRRFRALDCRDRWLVVEAIILIGIVQAGIRALRFSMLRRLLAGAKRVRSGAQEPQARIGWAVDAAARLIPGRSCLSDALVADVMLCRRGYQSTLRLGVRKRHHGNGAVEAHAWVECDGSIVAGRLETLDEYRVF
jgi:hypothetical protein